MIGGLLKNTSALAMVAAAGLVIGGVAMTPKAARAADLGGDCCADLEERVAALEATTVRKGNKKVTLTISGRMAFAAEYWSDNSSGPAASPNGPVGTTAGAQQDAKSDFYVGDFTGNGPNIVFDGAGQVNKDVSIGYHMELDFDDTGSNAQNARQGNPAISNSQTFVFVSSKSAGKLQIGSEQGVLDDLGGTGYATAYMAGLQGSLRGTQGFLLRSAAGVLTGTKYGSYFSGLDSSQDNGIKYTSPTFGNLVSFEAAYSGDDTWSVGALISGHITKQVQAKVGVAYQSAGESDGVGGLAGTGIQAHINQATQADTLAISGGVDDAGSGLFLTGDYADAYAQGSVAGHLNDLTTWQVLGGWHKNVNGLGVTEIWGSYVQTANMVNDNSKGTAWQVGIDQAIDAASSHVFLTYENDDVKDLVVAPEQNLSTLIGGMAITF